MKRNNYYILKKYYIKKGQNDLLVFPNKSEQLFAFGIQYQNGSFKGKDITISKINSNNSNCCEQYSYDYKDDKHSLYPNFPKKLRSRELRYIKWRNRRNKEYEIIEFFEEWNDVSWLEIKGSIWNKKKTYRLMFP